MPCNFKRQGMTSRCFSADIFWDPKEYREKEDEWLDKLNAVISGNESDMFLRDGSLGWLRPYEISVDKMVMPVRHPLYALSSHGITEEGDDKSSAITDMSSAFLAFLLYPVLTSVREMGFHPSELNVIVAGPAYLSRLAEGILYKVLKRMAFRRIVILNHSVALAMHFLRLSSVQKIGVLNMDDNCLHVTRIGAVRDDENVNIEHVSTRSLKELGWDAIRDKIAEVFYRDGLLANPDKLVLDRALSGLFGGMLSTNIPTNPGLRMTYGLLAEKLGGDLGERLSYEVSVRLMPVIDELGLNDAEFFVASGSFFMIGGFEKLVLNAVEKYQPARVRRILAMERTAYGIAEMLRWLGESQGRCIRVQHNYSVRIASEQDKSIELAPAGVILPLKTGKKSMSVKQVLGLDARSDMEKDELVVDILWGNNLIPRYNTSLCTLSYEVSADDIRDDNMLELTFDLKGTSRGLKGEVTAALGGQQPKPPRKLHFPKSSDMTVLSGL